MGDGRPHISSRSVPHRATVVPHTPRPSAPRRSLPGRARRARISPAIAGCQMADASRLAGPRADRGGPLGAESPALARDASTVQAGMTTAPCQGGGRGEGRGVGEGGGGRRRERERERGGERGREGGKQIPAFKHRESARYQRVLAGSAAAAASPCNIPCPTARTWGSPESLVYPFASDNPGSHTCYIRVPDPDAGGQKLNVLKTCRKNRVFFSHVKHRGHAARGS